MRVLLCLDSVGRTKGNIRVTHLDRLSYGGAAASLVRDVVFRATASMFTVSRAAARCCLRLCLSFVAG